MGGNPSDGAMDVYSVSGVSGDDRKPEGGLRGMGMDWETGRGIWE